MQGSQGGPGKPLVTLPSLCAALSRERLGAYSDPTDLDSTDAVARYLWNGALCAGFQPSLHALEVTLRNALFRESCRVVNTTGHSIGAFGCWLDATPSLLLAREQDAVAEARRRLGGNPKFHTSGRLVAKLGFGFWTALCRRPYGHGRPGGPNLWPRLLPQVFPHMPKTIRTRENVSARLDDIREFRNRIAHHEPIWDRNLLVHYDEILEALGWMNPSMRLAARACSEVELLFHVGPGQYRALAAKLLGAEV